jgi:hypothetical protein
LAAACRRPWARLTALFVAVPAALFGLPAAFGATWLVGDNLIQNYPLRVLVGTDVRQGQLPLWDPYLWSGSPLLSAFNAGAAYPATWLFAVLPGALAWVANQALVEVVAATGMLFLLRVLGRSWTAAALGAAAFTYGGFMAAQSVHLDVVEAAAWLPWAFGALDRIAHRPEGRSAAPWVALLAGSLGLMGLSGAAEPILDGGVVLAVYAVWLWVRTPKRRLALVVGGATAVVVGLLLAAVQLVPGALAQAQSQRAVHDYAYFTSGSMNKSLTLLGLDPLLFGGVHQFPLSYFATYNLPEVSSYIGILPVMGLLGLLARRHRRHPEAPSWRIWYAIVVIGAVLTWGDFTPLGHVLFHVPLFNRQRLLSRNLLEVDLAVAVLFAAWVDHMLLSPAPSPAPAPVSAPAPGPPAGRRRWFAGGLRSDVVLPLLPPLAVVGLQVVLLAGGTWLPHFVHVPGPVTRSSLWPLVAFLTVPSAIAVAAGALVVGRHRLARLMPRLLGALVVVDLVVFNVFVQGVPDPQAATSAQDAWANAVTDAVTDLGPGPGGGLPRMAIFDPDRYYPVQTNRLGQPDLTILRHLVSVQGYGAVVDAGYDRATGTHLQLNMTPAKLADGTFASLDLGVLVSVPEYFVHLVTAPPEAPQTSTAPGAVRLPPVGPDPAAPDDRSLAPATTSEAYEFAPAPEAVVRLRPGHNSAQYFGTVLSVTSVSVPVRPVAGTATVRVGVLSPDGSPTTWIGSADLGAGNNPTVTVTAARPVPAAGIVLQATGAVGVGAAVVRTEGQGTYRVDGSLRDDVDPGRWRFDGTIGPFSVFSDNVAGMAWVQGSAGATARVVSSTSWGAVTVRVHSAHPATLVRSEQFAAGWQATVRSAAAPSGAGRAETVQRHGLVQAVAVPAGTSLVSFSYRPHRVDEGVAATVVGVLALLALSRWPRLRPRLVRRRPAALSGGGRRRRGARPRRTGPGAPGTAAR